MQIAGAISGVTTLGPGNRLCVWVNGCARRCKGCINPVLRLPDPRNERSITEFFCGYDFGAVDGITVSGGEPFDQPQGLAEMVELFAKEGKRDVLVYTGYTYEQLRARHDKSTDTVLDNIAVLIDGPYIDERNCDNGRLRGSDNQRIIVLREEYSAAYAEYDSMPREIERFGVGERVIAVGVPTRAQLKKFISEDEE